MRIYIDTEFIERKESNKVVLDLISIGLVKETGEKYYAINKDCDLSKASEWVKENVIAQLPPKNPMPNETSPRLWEESKAWKDYESIMIDVALFCGCSMDMSFPIRKGLLGLWDKFLYEFELLKPKYHFALRDYEPVPEFWADWGAYDWIALCGLFGNMIDLPKGFPMYCNDLQQLVKESLHTGIIKSVEELPKQTKGFHNALEDALHAKEKHEYIFKQQFLNEDN